MQVLLDRPLGLRQRLDILRAARLLGDTEGWLRVLLYGRTGPLPRNSIKYDWFQVDVVLGPGVAPAVVNEMITNLRTTGWTIRHWMVPEFSPKLFCVRASRRRCLACELTPELRAKLRRSPCSNCSGRGYVR
jgi:hypothetical protein